MRSSHNFHLDAPIRLSADNFGSPSLCIAEGEELRRIVLHDVTSSDDLLRRAVEAFNAVMDGQETPPRTVPIVAVIEDRDRPQVAAA